MLLQVVANERQALLGELHSLRTIGRDEHSPLTALLIEGAALQTSASLELLERAEAGAVELTRGEESEARSRQRTGRQRRVA